MILIGMDLDGTLEDSRADMTSSVHRVRKGLSLAPRPDGSVRPWVNKGMDALYRACFDDYIGGDGARINDVRRWYEDDYLEHVAVETRLYPEIASALPQLAVLGRVAVITNKPERISRRLLEVLGVDKWITTVIGGDSCVESKPDPALLVEAGRRCGMERSGLRAVMIGDTDADIRMGREFGARTIWASWGYVEQIGAEPDLIARRPSDLPSLVRRAGSSDTE